MNQQYQKSLSTRSSSATSVNEQNGIRQVIPSGTVASYVRLLQGLSNSSPSTTSSPSKTRRRENSRTGFGRRVTNRFANPALQNATPDQQPQAPSGHSFLGLNTPRSNHQDGHATSQHRITCTRSPRISGQIWPQGHIERTQNDAVLPWNVKSQEPSSDGVCEANRADVNVHQECDYTGSYPLVVAPSTMYPSTVDSDYQDIYRRETRSHTPGDANSGISLTTASSTPRKSVRDLFDDYGIERPIGLASSTGTPKPTKPHRYCHLCSWVNSGFSRKCWRCSHFLCYECDDMSPSSTGKETTMVRRESFSPRDLGSSVPELPPKKDCYINREPTKREPKGPKPSQLQSRSGASRPERKPSVTKFPDFYQSRPLPVKFTQIASPHKISVQDIPKVINILSGSKVTTSVKDSPFVIADLSSNSRSLHLIPTGIEDEDKLSQRSHSSCSQNTESDSKEPLSPDIEECESPSCRATHPGYLPYRHSISCSVKAQSAYDIGAADITYGADEFVEIPGKNQIVTSKPHPITSSRVLSLSSPKSQSSRKTRPSRISRMSAPVSQYNECRGHPRTGYNRHGYQIGTGSSGQCQHFHDDCQYTADQSTHLDHSAMVHRHHYTSRKCLSDAKPFECSSKDQKPSANERPPPINTPETVVLSPSKSGQGPFIPNYLYCIKQNFQRASSLPRLEASTFMREAKDPTTPTPPPWMISSRTEDTLLTTDYPSFIRMATIDDAATGISSVETRPSASKSTTPLKDDFSRYLTPTSKPDDEAWCSHYSNIKNGNTREKRCIKPILSRRGSVILKETSRSLVVGHEISSPQKLSLSRPRGPPRRLSALLQLRERNAIPALNQKLLDHQEELRKVDGASDAMTEVISREEVSKRYTPKAYCADDMKAAEEIDRVSSATSNRSIKWRWKLKLIDKKSSPPCPTDNPESLEEHQMSQCSRVPISLTESPKSHCLSEEESSPPCTDDHNPIPGHRLSQDEPLHPPKLPLKATWLKLPLIKLDDHEFFWKNKVIVGPQSHGDKEIFRVNELGIRGVTVTLHLDGRENLVVEADFGKGGELIE